MVASYLFFSIQFEMNAGNKQWGLTILQGVILCITGFLLLFNAANNLQPYVFLIGFTMVITGFSGIFEWFICKSFDRDLSDFIWSILCLVGGILLFVFKNHELHTLNILLSIWLLISTLWIALRSWELQWIHSLSWAMTIAGILSFFLGCIILISPKDGDLLNMKLLASSFLLIGISLLLLGYIKKKLIQDG
jgi:uncharacterized membrane protein HdeD (DUF308 family)